MNYIDHLNLFGVEAKEIPCIKGSGAPTQSTVGAVGLFYMNTDNGDVYKCVAAEDDVYAWESMETASTNSGGNVDYVGVEPAEDDMPKVFITGVKPTTKDDVLAEMQYNSKTDSFHAYLEIKCQGTSSMAYDKKNFTVKMYSDEARETKLKKSFKDWNHNGNKYVLKANWIDHSHARNIICARLWDEVVSSRPDYDSLPVEMRTSPRNGAVDGFPVKVYYNGTYEGIYTWNIGKDDWMWNMDEDNPNHVLLCAETNTDGNYRATPCNFRALWSGTNEQDWSIEVGTNSTALKTSLNNLIRFVMDNDGDAFKNGIGAYLDIQSAIDYYIHQYVICGLDGLAKNMLLATYDGTKWICGAYDMDSTFGLYWNASKFVSAEYACPEDYQEKYSLLWERIEVNYVDELKARYAELRKTVYSYANMVTHFERFTDLIGSELYAEDQQVYVLIPLHTTNNIKQIRNYIRDRLAYCDGEFAAMILPVPCTGITLSASTLTFESTDSQTVTATVEPSDTTDSITWVSSAEDIVTVVDGVITPVANGNVIITATCGEFSAECAVTVNIAGLVMYSVTNNLTNISSNNSVTSIAGGTSYTATLTADTGYELGEVAVTMGGTDITASAYANGTITIDSVTGNIVITASGAVPKSYGLKMSASNPAETQMTVRGGQITTIVATLDIPDVSRGIKFLSYPPIWFGITYAGEWKNATSDTAVSDIAGAGKKTVTLSNMLEPAAMPNANFILCNWADIDDSSGADVTVYNIKIYDADGTLRNDISPTSTIGQLYDSVRNLTYTFSDTTGMELVEG